MTQFRVKNQFTHRPQSPQIPSFFCSHAVSVPHLKVRGGLSHLSPRALLPVITQAAITRVRHTCTHLQCAGRNRQTSLWLQISMRTLCRYCRTRAPASELLWSCVFRDRSVGHAAGLQGAAKLAFISDHPKA